MNVHPKPHIWRHNGRWYCGLSSWPFGEIIKSGRTPDHAYSAYVRELRAMWAAHVLPLTV